MLAPEWLTQGQPIAHRGLHTGKLPENTLGAFQRAVDKGFPIELDLQMTGDNKLVVFHDRNTVRMTGQPMGVTTTRLSRLRRYPVLGTDAPMPTFAELLDLVAGKVPLVIEVKPAKLRHAERAFAVARALRGYRGDFVLQSFDPRIVKCLKKHTKHPTGLIVGRYKDPSVPKELRRRLEATWLTEAQAASMNPDFIAHDLKLLAPGISDKVREKKKLPLLTWTVKDSAKVAQAQVLADNYIFEQFLPETE